MTKLINYREDCHSRAERFISGLNRPDLTFRIRVVIGITFVECLSIRDSRWYMLKSFI